MHIIIHVTFNNTSVHVFHNFETMNCFPSFFLEAEAMCPSLAFLSAFSNKSFAFLFVSRGSGANGEKSCILCFLLAPNFSLKTLHECPNPNPGMRLKKLSLNIKKNWA